MDDRNYKNYKIALTHSKVTTTSISPYLSHLNGTFFASSVFHEMLTEHYNVQCPEKFWFTTLLIASMTGMH